MQVWFKFWIFCVWMMCVAMYNLELASGWQNATLHSAMKLMYKLQVLLNIAFNHLIQNTQTLCRDSAEWIYGLLQFAVNKVIPVGVLRIFIVSCFNIPCFQFQIYFMYIQEIWHYKVMRHLKTANYMCNQWTNIPRKAPSQCIYVMKRQDFDS